MKWAWMTAGVLAGASVFVLPASSHADTRIGIGVVLGSDHRDHGRYDRRYRDTFRIGFDRGYQEGVRHGAKDGRRHDDYNFWHDRRYRKGDSGYRRDFGPKHEYVAGYRRGYEQAYRGAYTSVRHRHAGRDEYCYERHDDRYDRDRYDRGRGRYDRDDRDDRYDRYER